MKLILILFICINIIYAKDVKLEELEELSLEELMDIKIYSATKSYQRAEEIPANITILRRKDIQKYNYTTLDELLKHIPGIFIIDDTEHFQIGLRGSLGSSFKLMINNNPISPLRIPQGATSNRNFFSTPVEAIDRIEIIKGPQAVTYGSNSMYGSINIITNDFNEKNIISISKGNNKQNKVFARINKAYENGGLTLNTSFFSTNGISGNLEDTFTPTSLNNHTDAKRNLDSLLENEYKTIDLSHRYKNLTTDITYSKTNYEVFLNPTYRDGNEVEQSEKTLALTYEDDFNRDLTYKVNLISSQKNYNVHDIETSKHILYGSSNYIKDRRNQIDIHFNYRLNENISLLLGSTYKHIKESQKKTSESRAARQSHDYKYYELDYYSKLHYKVNNSFEVNAGIRYNKKSDFNIERNLLFFKTNLNPYIKHYIKEEKDYLPEFSAIYHINSNNHIKFLHGKAKQLTYQKIDEYEEIESSEINYMYISNKYQINSSLFYNKASNISIFTQSGGNAPSSNIGDKKTRGLEFALKYKVNNNFETNTSL
ncbi:MAG: TonB-dependent receptor, partial [Arcobacter sp.]|nr:TonB-dependent receptor [Arcobacter sp.]